MTAHVLSSKLLAEHGIPHGFSTRIGGVSTGPSGWVHAIGLRVQFEL